MLEHKAYPIQDYQKGLYSAKEPWLSPEASWSELENAFVREGTTRARGGFRLLSELIAKQEGVSITGTIAITAPPSTGLMTLDAATLSIEHDITRIIGQAAPVPFTCTDGTETWTDTGTVDGNGRAQLTGSLGGLGLLDLQPFPGKTACELFLVANGTLGTTITITQLEANVDEPVMDVGEFIPESNPTVYSFWAVSTRRFYVWNAAQSYFEDQTDKRPGAGGVAADIFTGDESNRFWMEPFGDRLIMTNGVDEPYWYAPLDSGGVGEELLRPLKLTFDEDQGGGGANARRIWTAEIALNHKGRILYMFTREGLVSGGIGAATSFPGRVRRSQVNNAEGFDSADQAGGSLKVSDAPTNQRIRSAVVRGNDAIVFFSNDESWVHEYVGDPRAEYEWRELSLMRGSDAKKSTVPVYQDALTLNSNALIATDGRVLSDIDEDIPRFIIERLDYEYLERAEAYHFFTGNQTWHAIYFLGTQDPVTLVRNYKNGSYSLFNWPFTCFGYFRSAEGRLIVDDYVPPDWPATVDEFDPDLPVDAYVSGSPVQRLPMGGTRDGKVYLLLQDGKDAGQEVGFRALTHRLNPFKNEALAHLGWFDLLMTAHPGKTLTVRLYNDFSDTQYASQVLDLTPTGSNQKVRRVVSVNQVGSYHRIELEASDVPGFRLESLELWMAPISETVTPI